MYGQWRRPNIEPTAFGQAMAQSELYDPKTSAVVRAFAEEATIGVGTSYADLQAARIQEADQSPESSFITEDEYKNSAELYSEGVSWHDGMTRESALVSKEYNDAARKRAQIIQDASTAQSIAGFAVGFGAGVFEPKNLAVGVAASVALPGLGSLGFLGKNLQRAYQMRKTAKLGQRALIGAAEGVAAGVAVEPSSRYSAKILQQDYTMLDSLFNVATSTAFGAGLPVVAKGIGAAPKFMQEKVAKFKGRTMDVVTAEVDLATQQLELGQRVDVGVVEAGEVGSVAKRPVAEQVKLTGADLPQIQIDALKYPDADSFAQAAIRGEFDLQKYQTPEQIEQASIVAKSESELSNVIRQSQKLAREIGTDDPTKKQLKVIEGLSTKRVVLEEKISNAKASPAKGFVEVSANKEANLAALKELYNQAQTKVSEATAQADTANTQTLAKAQADALDPRNDILIDYDTIDAMDERRAIQATEADAEAEIYYQQAEVEIRQMLADDILNDADLAEYQSALEELNSRAPIDALETLKMCFTRG